MKTIHFTSGDYITIKNENGSYSFAGRGKYEMLQHMTRLSNQAERIKRELVALGAFLDGESVSNPNALR
jgi:hypothetical protein